MAAPAATAAAVVQQKAVEPEDDKFAGEDEGEDEPAYKAHIPEPQQVSWRNGWAVSDCLLCASSSWRRPLVLADLSRTASGMAKTMPQARFCTRLQWYMT